jgi:segregation and condensation protein B
MAGSSGARTRCRQGNDPQHEVLLDRELGDLPPDLRWREWMLRIEAVIFAAAEPVTREVLARVVGKDCAIDLLIDDLREELRSRPYDVVSVAGGWHHRSRSAYASTIRAAQSPTRSSPVSLSEHEAAVLAAIAYLQPVTRGELSALFGKDVSRDTIASLRDAGFLGSGPRSPTPGTPYTYVTTKHFLLVFGLETLRELPDLERLEDAGLLSRQALLREEFAEESSDGDEQE